MVSSQLHTPAISIPNTVFKKLCIIAIMPTIPAMVVMHIRKASSRSRSVSRLETMIYTISINHHIATVRADWNGSVLMMQVRVRYPQ